MRALDRILEGISAGILFASAVVTFIGVILRYLFNTSFSWSFEMLQLSLVYLTYITSYVALRHKVHLSVDVFVRKLPVAFQCLSFIFVYLTIGVVAGVMVYYGSVFAFSFSGKTTEVTGLPVVAIYIIIPLSGLAMLFEVVRGFYVGISKGTRGMIPEAITPLPGEETMTGGPII